MYEYREKRTLLVLLLGTLCSVSMVHAISCYRPVYAISVAMAGILRPHISMHHRSPIPYTSK